MDLAIKLEIKSKSQRMIKAQSLKATLPTIIFIHNVYVSLQEQDYQEGAGVRERYEVYKNVVQSLVIKRLLSLPSG